MHCYTAFGLVIQSDLALPELLAATPNARPDISLRLAPLPCRPPPDPRHGACYHVAPDETCISWNDAGLCAILNGNQLLVEPLPTADPRTLRLYLLNTALAVLLHQRRHLVLHGSAVLLRTHAIAFLGDCGAGKSTTAAALVRRGHPLLTDDLTVLTITPLTGSTPVVLPAFPLLRLCPDAATALGHDPATLPLVRPDEDKRLQPAPDNFSPSLRPPLSRIYLLTDAPDLRITTPAPSLAIMALIRNSFTARLLQRTGTAPEHLAQCAAIAPLVRTLERPRDLAALDALAALLESAPTVNDAP